MAIQVLKPKYRVEECLEEIKECLEVGWTGLGFKTVEFENKWKEYTNHNNAHFLNSATAGLHLAVKILKMENNWSDEDEILTTPITFVSTNHAILYESMVPVFVDVDEYLCIDPVDLEKKITKRSKAVIFVGYGGRVGQLEKVVQLCKQYNLKLILDAAHMTGTRVNGVFPGTWDGVDVTVYSFQAVKNLPTSDSGMICFSSNDYDALCRKLTWLGINKDTFTRSNDKGTYKWRYSVDYLGYKYHGNSIIAAIGIVQLKYVDEDNEYRRKLARTYDKCFENNDKVRIIDAPYKDECSYHIYEIEVEDRDGLMNELAKHEIYAGVHYRDNREYSLYHEDIDTCPKAKKVSNHILTLPLHLWLSEEDILKIAEVVNNYTSGNDAL